MRGFHRTGKEIVSCVMFFQALDFMNKIFAVAISFIIVLLPFAIIYGVVHFMKHRNKTEEPTEL